MASPRREACSGSGACHLEGPEPSSSTPTCGKSTCSKEIAGRDSGPDRRTILAPRQPVAHWTPWLMPAQQGTGRTSQVLARTPGPQGVHTLVASAPAPLSPFHACHGSILFTSNPMHSFLKSSYVLPSVHHPASGLHDRTSRNDDLLGGSCKGWGGSRLCRKAGAGRHGELRERGIAVVHRCARSRLREARSRGTPRACCGRRA